MTPPDHQRTCHARIAPRRSCYRDEQSASPITPRPDVIVASTEKIAAEQAKLLIRPMDWEATGTETISPPHEKWWYVCNCPEIDTHRRK